MSLVLLLLGCFHGEPSQPAERTVVGSDDAPSERVVGEADVLPLEVEHIYLGGARPDREAPLVIALHGRGDRPAHFGRLYRGFPGVAHVVVPKAPNPLGGGFSWFDAGAAGEEAALVSAILRSSERVAGLLRSLRQQKAPVVITGFSQGGMLSYAMASSHPELIDLAIPISGFLPSSLHEASEKKPAPVRALHGGKDSVISADAAQATIDALRKRGGDVRLARYEEAAHEVTPAMRRKLFVWLGEAVAPVNDAP